MKTFKTIFLLCLSLCVVNPANADSPLTSTFFAPVYKEIKTINDELSDDGNMLSADECEFLYSTSVPMDQKMAFINALGWGDSTIVSTYADFLAKKLQINRSVFDSLLIWRGGQPTLYEPANKLKADDYACLAYLQVMGNYFAPLKGYYCAYRAADLNSESEATSYIYGLLMAQFFLDRDWCETYKVMHTVKNFGTYTKDMLKPEAIEIIFDYINDYASSCNEERGLNEQSGQKILDNSVADNVYKRPAQNQTIEVKNDYVDLEIVSIKAPEYSENIKGTVVKVTIRNKGTISNIETVARMSDLDLALADAKKLKLTKQELNTISENNANASGTGEWVKPNIDNDIDFTIYQKIPTIQPDESIEIEFQLYGIWIYDPNCEILIELDAEKHIEEKNEKNNIKLFIAQG